MATVFGENDNNMYFYDSSGNSDLNAANSHIIISDCD